ncbi:endonuclease/exonuclease/phosphatase family protein [Bifidobacterium mizhiense]|uniref:endonuclease/exonuclease/phosphatase family protein n=1 Tax=Bifidobacterium mizhiense TaxID=2879940 RepID=UPI001E31F8BF|nr:endonuclease/exonuclease/phosphatase family protein [Bifidobacterium mizhiense]
MNTLLWILLGLIALWMALRFLPAGADWHRPLVELIALIDLLAVPLLAILIWTVFTRAWPQCLLALVELILVSCQRLGYRLPPADRTSHPSSDHGLSVMTLNCRFGRADPEEVVRCVQAYGIEVLALQEVEGRLLESLQDAGLNQLLPYLTQGVANPEDNGGHNVIFSANQPVKASPSAVNLPAAAIPLVELKTSCGPIRVASVHPKSPQRGARQWGIGIAALTKLTQPPVPTIVMGDCNATLQHPTFRAMLAKSGLHDASLHLKAGSHPTFPSASALPPLIEIDHILTDGDLVPQSMRALRIPGSDHRALVAQLTLQRRL